MGLWHLCLVALMTVGQKSRHPEVFIAAKKTEKFLTDRLHLDCLIFNLNHDSLSAFSDIFDRFDI